MIFVLFPYFLLQWSIPTPFFKFMIFKIILVYKASYVVNYHNIPVILQCLQHNYGYKPLTCIHTRICDWILEKPPL